MGNLYTDEALHYAKIHPLRPANKLKPDDWRRLHAGILEALRMGIDGRGSSLGSTLRDHINVDGAPGQNQETVRAYGREGEPCLQLRRRSCAASRSAAAAASSARSASPPRGALRRGRRTKRRRKAELHAKPSPLLSRVRAGEDESARPVRSTDMPSTESVLHRGFLIDALDFV